MALDHAPYATPVGQQPLPCSRPGNVFRNLAGVLDLLRQREAKLLVLQQLREQVARDLAVRLGVVKMGG